MAKAVTDIRHGSADKEGKVTTYEVAAGDKVDKAKFTKEEWQTLIDSGAVSEDDNAEPTGSFQNTADNQNAADGSPVSTDDEETHQAKLDAKAEEAKKMPTEPEDPDKGNTAQAQDVSPATKEQSGGADQK